MNDLVQLVRNLDKPTVLEVKLADQVEKMCDECPLRAENERLKKESERG